MKSEVHILLSMDGYLFIWGVLIASKTLNFFSYKIKKGKTFKRKTKILYVNT